MLLLQSSGRLEMQSKKFSNFASNKSNCNSATYNKEYKMHRISIITIKAPQKLRIFTI